MTGTVSPCGCAKPDLQPDEFLKGQCERLSGSSPAPVNDAARRQPLATRQRQGRRLQRGDPCVQAHGAAKLGERRLVQLFSGDGLIRRPQRPREFGEAHHLPWPAMRDERRHPAILLGRQVGRVTRPGVIAAEALPRFDDEQAQLRPPCFQPAGRKRRSQPAAGEDHIIIGHETGPVARSTIGKPA